MFIVDMFVACRSSSLSLLSSDKYPIDSAQSCLRELPRAKEPGWGKLTYCTPPSAPDLANCLSEGTRCRLWDPEGRAIPIAGFPMSIPYR